MTTLSEWLLAQIAEDERTARNGRWATTGTTDRRLLAECDAKRADRGAVPRRREG